MGAAQLANYHVLFILYVCRCTLIFGYFANNVVLVQMNGLLAYCVSENENQTEVLGENPLTTSSEIGITR